MPLTISDCELTEQDLDRIAASDHDVDETIRRALALYDELEEADEIIADCDLLADPDERA